MAPKSKGKNRAATSTPTEAEATVEKTDALAEKRAARAEQNAAQMKAIVDRVVNGDEKLAAVAKELKITPGKAAFLIMQHRVSQAEVPSITGKDDEALVKAINDARLKADEFSSWGWLAARSGKAESWIKSNLASAGLYEPKAQNIASVRASAKPKAEPKAKAEGGKKSGGKKKVRGNA
jgi:hypothetical protein